jgi:hypothetical protein
MFTPTKYMDSKMSIDRREEPIHKTNKPPSDADCDGYRKQDATAKAKQIIVIHQGNKNFMNCIKKPPKDMRNHVIM